MTSMESARPSTRQLKLFPTESPLVVRLGTSFFRALPERPGVYFFSDEGGRLLYIGQSADLRARIGSYRHVTPEKNPRRTLRLVQRVHKIEWKVCASARAAIELEAAMLLEHRPPFNRAGVWQGEPWWLRLEPQADRLHLELVREGPGIGPLPSAFRHAFGSLARCLYRLSQPDLPLTAYPHGLFSMRVPLTLKLPLPAAELETTATFFKHYAEGRAADLLDRLPPLATCPKLTLLQQEYWQDEIEAVMRFARKLAKSATGQPSL